MTLVLVTAGAFGVLMGMMGIGVMLGRKPLQGSCGGQDSDCSCTASEKEACGQTGGRKLPSAPGQIIALDRVVN